MEMARKRSNPCAWLPALLALLLLAGAGCRTYDQKNKVIRYWRAGDMTNAVAEATRQASKYAGGKDALIWRLEEGAVLRAAGRYADSNRAFEQAQETMDGFYDKAKVRVGQETVALLSNQANLDYEGRSYDGVMLNTYRALNYLALGDLERARPELIRAYQRQQSAVEENRKRIEKVRQELENSKEKKLTNKAEADPGFQAQLQRTMTNLADVKIYADYVNPFTVYLDGLYFMASGSDASDFERARKSFERVAGFVEGNEYVKQALAMADGLANGNPLAPTTFVVFETGCAPVREQIRISIPIIFSKVSYVGAAFPTIKLQGDYQPSLTVTAAGTNHQTQTVSSMDSVIVADYKDALPVVIIKTVAATLAKATAAYVVNDAGRRQGDTAGLITQLITMSYQMAVNIADTRTWTTLPKQFQVCHFPTPPDGRIELATPNGMKMPFTVGGGEKIDLTTTNAQATLNKIGLINVVYVKSVTAGTPLLISQFKLK